MSLKRDLAALDRALAGNPAPQRSARSRIVRVIKIVDTRLYEEGPDGKWHPIPGSGSEHECARCGKAHEVHAEVQLSDGTHELVGTGCAARESMEAGEGERIQKAEAKAKRLARMRAELAGQTKWLAEYREATAAVYRLTPPAFEHGERPLPASGKMMRTLRVGDVEVWCPYGLDQERQDAATSTWYHKRMVKRGFERPPVDDTRRLHRQIAALEREVGR